MTLAFNHSATPPRKRGRWDSNPRIGCPISRFRDDDVCKPSGVGYGLAPVFEKSPHEFGKRWKHSVGFTSSPTSPRGDGGIRTRSALARDRFEEFVRFRRGVRAVPNYGDEHRGPDARVRQAVFTECSTTELSSDESEELESNQRPLPYEGNVFVGSSRGVRQARSVRRKGQGRAEVVRGKTRRGRKPPARVDGSPVVAHDVYG